MSSEIRVLVIDDSAADAEASERAALRARSDESDRFFDLAIDLMCVIGLDGRFRRVNPAWTRVLGYTTEELVGSLTIDLIHPDDREATLAARARLKDDKAPLLSFENRYRCKDGSYRVLLWMITPFAEEQALYGVARDVTERKRRDEEVRVSEAHYRAQFENSPLAKWVVDADTLTFIEVNEAAIRQYGYSRDEFLKMTLADIRPPEEAPILAEIARATRAGQAMHRISKHRRKNGEILDVEVDAHRISLGGREVRHAVVRDVTERRRLEDQLFQSQKMEAIGLLAGGVAHDFNNLLAVIMMGADFALEELGREHPVAPEIEAIASAAQRAAALTRQLLAFSRKHPQQPRAVALNLLVTNLEKLLSRVIGEDIALSVALADNLGSIYADPGHVEQVLMNLVVNARDAMPTGGKLTIETSNVAVDEARARRLDVSPGQYVLLSVADTGVGMDAATIARIFEPFFTTKEVGKGTGLGLSTLFGIVKEALGAVSVDSEVDRGTTFSLYFPRADAPRDSVAPDRAAASLAEGTETILLVEDDEQLRAVLRRQLAARGYTVIEAPNGRAAVEALRTGAEIDLILTDLVMPEMDGRTMARRALEQRPGAIVLYMSGYSEHAAVKGALEPGDRFLHKPFTGQDLAIAVRRALDER